VIGTIRRKLVSARIGRNKATSSGLQRNGGEYLELFGQKHLLGATLRGAGLAAVQDLALLSGRNAFEIGAGPECLSGVEEYLDGLVPGRYFIKPSVGEHGNGAGCLDADESGLLFNGRNTSTGEIARAAAKSKAGLLLQAWQAQHEDMRRFCPNTLNTLRVLTLQHGDGSVQVLHAVLRVGRKAAWLDNFHAGGIAMKVDLESGRTVAPAVRLDQSETYTHHPDTGMALDAQQVPEFVNLLQLVSGAHRLFLGLRTVGWDVAIAPEGPIMVEGNLTWDAEIHAFTDPDFRAMANQAMKAA